MITRPAEEWLDTARSGQIAEAISRLTVTYNEAIAATYHLHGLRILEIGGLGSGRSWVEMISSFVLDVLVALGLLVILVIVSSPWAAGLPGYSLAEEPWAQWLQVRPTISGPLGLALGVTAIWVILTDALAEYGLFYRWIVAPLIHRLDPQRIAAWESSIVVLGRLVRDEVIRHVRANLNRIGGVLSVGIELTRQHASGVQQENKAAVKLLEEALHKVKAVRKNTADFAATSSLWSKLLDKIPWKEVLGLVPTAGLSWGLLDVWQGVGLCLAWVLAYHILGLLGLVFFDSAIRKELFFDGFMTRTSDNIKLSDTPVSKQEKKAYELLGIPMPSVEPWAFVFWPLIHHVLTIAMIAVSFILWRQSSTPPLTGQFVVGVFGASILYHQVKPLLKSIRRLRQSK